MAAEVLQSQAQIDKALSELKKFGRSYRPSPLRNFLMRIGLYKGIRIGDDIKSWDVLKTARFIEEHLEQNAPVLDIGAYASEILCILREADYTNLTGVDLNPDIGRMPFADKIRYVNSDFMHTPFEDGSFAAITSISVIEHGFNAPALLAEMARLLRPGGYFIASFDYWPEKIDTSDTPFFGMDWKIFSKAEVLSFVQDAAAYGFVPCGELHLDASEKPIACANRKYTFGWIALHKASR
ncbi:MAG: class I SAM-dependent methyltransferase [Nitrospirota bacterium]